MRLERLVFVVISVVENELAAQLVLVVDDRAALHAIGLPAADQRVDQRSIDGELAAGQEILLMPDRVLELPGLERQRGLEADPPEDVCIQQPGDATRAGAVVVGHLEIISEQR